MKMKKFNIKNLNKKTSILSVLLLIAVIGVGATIALAVAQTSPVVNTFKAGEIDTSIDENVDTNFNKSVKVTNSAEAESDAYVRVRLNHPDEIGLNLSEESTSTWEDGNDGFYYYLYSLEPGTSTTELLSSLNVPEGYTEAFDVTVYQESCIATQVNRYDPDSQENQPLELEDIQKAFKDATGTEHEAE